MQEVIHNPYIQHFILNEGSDNYTKEYNDLTQDRDRLNCDITDIENSELNIEDNEYKLLINEYEKLLCEKKIISAFFGVSLIVGVEAVLAAILFLGFIVFSFTGKIGFASIFSPNEFTLLLSFIGIVVANLLILIPSYLYRKSDRNLSNKICLYSLLIFCISLLALTITSQDMSLSVISTVGTIILFPIPHLFINLISIIGVIYAFVKSPALPNNEATIVPNILLIEIKKNNGTTIKEYFKKTKPITPP